MNAATVALAVKHGVPESTALFVEDVLEGGTEPVVITGLTIPKTVASPVVKQADLTTNSGTGQPLSVHAQNETGTTSTGGDLNLASGTGTSADGAVNLKAGTTQGLKIETALITAALDVAFATGKATPKLYQADKTTASGTGALLTIQAQNETGVTSTGGGLDLKSGTGTSADGAVKIKTGTTLRFTADATGIGFYGHASVALQTGVAVTAGGIHAALVALGLITA